MGQTAGEGVDNMAKKPKTPKTGFIKQREEFAGEIVPGFYPGPITQAHGDRFYKDVSRQPPPPAEDTGEK